MSVNFEISLLVRLSFFLPLFKGFLKLGQKYKNVFVGLSVQMKTLKFAFEINWPLIQQLNLLLVSSWWIVLRNAWISNFCDFVPIRVPNHAEVVFLHCLQI